MQQVSAHGSGLGLALAAWIAERHHTTIEVESVEGVGSSIAWILPRIATASLEGPDGDLVAADHSSLATVSVNSDLR